MVERLSYPTLAKMDLEHQPEERLLLGRTLEKGDSCPITRYARWV